MNDREAARAANIIIDIIEDRIGPIGPIENRATYRRYPVTNSRAALIESIICTIKSQIGLRYMTPRVGASPYGFTYFDIETGRQVDLKQWCKNAFNFQHRTYESDFAIPVSHRIRFLGDPLEPNSLSGHEYWSWND